ncbi:MAG: DUF2905 family protein [Acidobacteriaceae bacterium]
MGRVLITVGLVLVVAGVVVVGLERMGVWPGLRWMGHLPGDFAWRSGGSRVYFPLATCVVLSAVLSVVLWVLGRMRR